MSLGSKQNRSTSAISAIPMNTRLRRAGFPAPGRHGLTTPRGQYVAKKVGRNDPCDCGESPPHKSKKCQRPARMRAEVPLARQAAAAAAIPVPTPPQRDTSTQGEI